MLNYDKYLNMLSECGFISLFNDFTWLPKNFNHSSVNNVFIDGNKHNITSKITTGVILLDITDHCMINFSVPNNDKPVNNWKIFYNINYKSIVSILVNENLTELYNICNDFNKCYNIFDKII